MTSNYLQKNEKERETILHVDRLYSQDIEMEFGMEKCAMLVMKSGNQHLTDGMELPNQDKIRTVEENETYNTWASWRLTSSDKMKEKIQKEYLRRPWKLLKTKLFSRNLIKGIHAWAVPLVRYLGCF